MGVRNRKRRTRRPLGQLHAEVPDDSPIFWTLAFQSTNQCIQALQSAPPYLVVQSNQAYAASQSIRPFCSKELSRTRLTTDDPEISL